MSDEPPDSFDAAWEAVVADMEATANEYREAGWDALELHPGDVTAWEGPERYGFDVLVPDDEYDRLEGFVADPEFDTYEVFRAENAGRVFALVAVAATREERAVLCPIFFDPSETEDLRARARTAGELDTRVRPLADDRGVTFTCEEPSLFFPGVDESDEATDSEA